MTIYAAAEREVQPDTERVTPTGDGDLVSTMAAAVVPQQAPASVMPEPLEPDWDQLALASSVSDELTFVQLTSGSLPWPA